MRCSFQRFRVSKISSKNWYCQGLNGMATWIILQLYRLDLRSYENHWTSIWNKAWKKIQACTGFEPMNFALPVQRNWEPVITSSVVFRHNCDDRFYIRFFNRSKHIWFSYVIAIIHQFEGLFESNIFPVGLLAQLVERCNGIAEVMGSNPVRAWIFFRPYFNY